MPADAVEASRCHLAQQSCRHSRQGKQPRRNGTADFPVREGAGIGVSGRPDQANRDRRAGRRHPMRSRPPATAAMPLLACRCGAAACRQKSVTRTFDIEGVYAKALKDGAQTVRPALFACLASNRKTMLPRLFSWPVCLRAPISSALEAAPAMCAFSFRNGGRPVLPSGYLPFPVFAAARNKTRW